MRKGRVTDGFKNKALQILLGILLAIVAVNAFGGGYYGMTGAEGVPLELLQGSPFSNYFIPGLILFSVVGGAFLFASVAVFAQFSYAYFASLVAIAIVFIWLVVQISIIGYVSWMQPATAIIAVIILFLAWYIFRAGKNRI